MEYFGWTLAPPNFLSTVAEELWAFCYLYCGYYLWNKFEDHFLTIINFFLFYRLCPLVFLIFLGLKIMKITALSSSVLILLMNVYNTTSISIFLNWSRWVLKCICFPPSHCFTHLSSHTYILYKFWVIITSVLNFTLPWRYWSLHVHVSKWKIRA